MPMDYSITTEVFGERCTLTGTTQLSSEAVEWFSGAGAGRNYDPATGRFAVAGTGYSPITATGECVRIGLLAYDLAAGAGWYLTGTLTVPPAQSQTAVVRPAKRIKADGRTVLLKKKVVTNAGQTATAKVTWSTRKGAAGKKPEYASAATKAGKVTITTTGKAKKLYVKLTLNAPAVDGYTPYSFAKQWTVKTVK